MFCLPVLFIYIILTNKNTFLNMPKMRYFWFCFELKANVWNLDAWIVLFSSNNVIQLFLNYTVSLNDINLVSSPTGQYTRMVDFNV